MRKYFLPMVAILMVLCFTISAAATEVNNNREYISNGCTSGNKTMEIQIPGNTEVIVKTIADITSPDELKSGDFIDLVAARDVIINGYTVIQSGNKAMGVIAMVKPRGPGGMPAQLQIQILAVNTIDNQTIPAYGVFSQAGRSRGKTVGLLALSLILFSIFNHSDDPTNGLLGLGASIGISSIHGGDLSVPAGTEIRTKTLGSVIIHCPAQ